MRPELEDLSGRSERSGRLGRSVLSERSEEGEEDLYEYVVREEYPGKGGKASAL